MILSESRSSALLVRPVATAVIRVIDSLVMGGSRPAPALAPHAAVSSVTRHRDQCESRTCAPRARGAGPNAAAARREAAVSRATRTRPTCGATPQTDGQPALSKTRTQGETRTQGAIPVRVRVAHALSCCDGWRRPSVAPLRRVGQRKGASAGAQRSTLRTFGPAGRQPRISAAVGHRVRPAGSAAHARGVGTVARADGIAGRGRPAADGRAGPFGFRKEHAVDTRFCLRARSAGRMGW